MTPCSFAIIEEKHTQKSRVYTRQRISHIQGFESAGLQEPLVSFLWFLEAPNMHNSSIFISYSPLSKIIQYLFSTSVTGIGLYCLLMQSKHNLLFWPLQLSRKCDESQWFKARLLCTGVHLASILQTLHVSWILLTTR